MASKTALPEVAARQREILRAVIREYIGTAQPVASAALVRRYRLEVSPATVRNDLAALEEAGLLTHPHTSAGRVPTDLGYRYFIESLMPEAALGAEEQVTVSHQFQQAHRDTSDWLRLAASTLARLTAEAAVVTPAAPRLSTLKHVEAVPISDTRALLVAVLDGGAVRQRLVDLAEPATTDRLRSLSASLSDALAQADSARIRAHADASRGSESEVARSLASLVEEHDAGRTRDVYYDGIQNIFAQPEFGEGERARELLGLLEDRSRLVSLLPTGMREGEVRVAIGHEHRHTPLQDCSLIFGRYGGRGGAVGYIGIVGPTRMDYARSIGAVRYVGSLMSGLVRAVEGD